VSNSRPAIPPKLITIDGTAFVISVLPAMKSPKAFKQLVRVAAPLMTEIAKVLGDAAVADLDIKDALFSGKLEGLAHKATELDDEAMLQLMLVLAEHCTVDGASLKTAFDLVFTGRLDTMVRWFIEAVNVNFGSFLQNMGGAKG